MLKNSISTSKRFAMIVTYGQIITQALSTFILTKYYISTLGEDAYGFYQMIYSVAQYILILDLGISATMIRYITEFHSRDDREKAENFAFHMLVIMFIILVVIVTVGAIVNRCLGSIYPSCTASELDLGQTIFKVMILQICVTILCHFAQGIALSYDRYAFVKGVSVVQIVLGAVMSILFIHFGMGIKGIVRANTVVILLSFITIMLYDIYVLRFKIKYHYLDLNMMKPALILMLAMLLQSVVGYVNSSVDKTILGRMTTKHDVSVYSIAATVVTMFNALPTAISSVFQPEAVRLVVKGSDANELTDFIAKPGRIQYMITGAFIAGFALFGRDFVICWTGESTVDAWLFVLLILVPNMIPLVQNTALAVLNALDKRIFRSIVLAGIVGINIILTVELIKWIGPIGAPLATGISYIIGHCIIMNLYYSKVLHLGIFRMFKQIFSRTTWCILLTSAFCFPLIFWSQKGSWPVLIVKVMSFCAIYFLCLCKFGFNNYERNLMFGVIRKVKRKFNK